MDRGGLQDLHPRHANHDTGGAVQAAAGGEGGGGAGDYWNTFNGFLRENCDMSIEIIIYFKVRTKFYHLLNLYISRRELNCVFD